MPHVLIAGQIHQCGIDILDAAPRISFDHVQEISVESFAGKLADADALILRTQPLSAAMIATAPRLRIVARHGVGVDAVDGAALQARGIPLAIVGDVNSTSVAELAMTFALTLTKRIKTGEARLAAGAFSWRNRLLAEDLGGKTLLIIGFGRIGRKLARMADAFGMKLLIHDPFIPDPGLPQADDLHAGLAAADVVSLHVPATPHPVIGAPELAAMRQGAVLINPARGSVVDEPALIAALTSGQIAGAGLDVFATEPPPPDHPFFQMGNVVTAPHIGGLTRQSAERMARVCAENIVNFFAGTLDPALVVNEVPDVR